jgi:hypothetical protein
MKIFIILMVMFSDGTPTLRSKLPVDGSNPNECVEMIRRMVVDRAPGEKWQGHPVKSWSAGCELEGIGNPT